MTDRRRVLDEKLDRLIADFTGHLSLFAKDMTTGEIIERRSDEVVPTASCIKVFIVHFSKRGV